HAIYNQKMCY
ncbi:hypothetical protein ACTFIV_005132, partial [Dictyostelium citrinum]